MLIKNMLFGYYETQCLHAITKLNIADHLQDGSKPIVELATLTGVNEDKLYRVMRFMAAKGIFNELPNQEFQMNNESKMLVSTSTDNISHFIKLHAEYFYNSVTELINSMKSNNTAFELKFGETASDHFKNNKAAGQIYHLAMKENTELSGKLITKAYDFSKYKTIIDVGGGLGSLLVNILLQNENSYGINFDIPELQENAEAYFREKTVASRCKYVGGDFFTSIPSGGDLYIMKTILHGKNEAIAVEVLSKCREVLPKHGKLLIIERVMCKDANNYIDVCINDINMLNVTNGHIRTILEFEQLFKQAGYLIKEIYTLPEDLSIMEITLQ